MVWIAFAIVFVVSLFFIKNRSVFKNTFSFVQGKQESGLVYNNAIIGDLVNKDTDKDGIPDWEESLWGTDPTKKETTPGISDSVAIEKLKKEQTAENNRGLPSIKEDSTKLTETDKFSRELFATVVSLNQNGAMDQATADKISSSLADQIKNSPPRKVFALADLKIVKNDTAQAVKNYNAALENLQKKYPVRGSVLDILQRFSADGNKPDVSVLSELDSIIKQIQSIINAVARMEVPQSLASSHLDFLNALQRLLENINDIKLYETDTILALGAISQYDKNTKTLQTATLKLSNAIDQKLKYNN